MKKKSKTTQQVGSPLGQRHPRAGRQRATGAGSPCARTRACGAGRLSSCAAARSKLKSISSCAAAREKSKSKCSENQKTLGIGGSTGGHLLGSAATGSYITFVKCINYVSIKSIKPKLDLTF